MANPGAFPQPQNVDIWCSSSALIDHTVPQPNSGWLSQTPVACDHDAVEDECHEDPRDLSLKLDGPPVDFEKRWIPPWTRWNERRPRKHVTRSQLCMVDEELDKDILRHEPRKQYAHRPPTYSTYAHGFD